MGAVFDISIELAVSVGDEIRVKSGSFKAGLQF